MKVAQHKGNKPQHNEIKQRRIKTIPKGKNRQAESCVQSTYTYDVRQRISTGLQTDTRRLNRETNEGNDGDTSGATETMIR